MYFGTIQSFCLKVKRRRGGREEDKGERWICSDAERKERDRDEQHIKSTYGSEMKGEKKAHGGQGNGAADQKRGKSSFWSFEALSA